MAFARCILESMATKWTRLDKAIGSIANWTAVLGGAFVAASAAFAWIGKKTVLFGELNWAEATLLGVVLALCVFVVISLGLVSWRIYRPIPGATAAFWRSDGFVSEDAIARPTLDQYNNLEERFIKLEERYQAHTRSLIPSIAAGYLLEASINRSKAMRLVNYIKAMTLPEPGQFSMIYDGFWKRAFHNAGRQAGIDTRFVEDLLSKAETEVKGDAAKYVLNPGDPWPTPEDKQRWHIHKRVIELFQNHIGQLEAELDASIDPENALRTAAVTADKC